MLEQFKLQVEVVNDAGNEYDQSQVKVFLFRAVQELLFNVVKHAKARSARVVLSSCDGWLTLTVSDKGKGFNTGILTDSDVSVTGLGLMKLKERTHYIGGNLLIDSTPGRGSQFIINVPTIMAKSLKRKSSHLAIFDQTQKTGEDKRYRILLVDDHKVMRQGLTHLIKDKPDTEIVGEAANGRQAIEQVRQLKPNVVLMDISMPKMDGIEATRVIKSEYPDIKIIGLSMHDDEQVIEAMLKAGAESFVPKTASSAKILKTIYGIEGKERD